MTLLATAGFFIFSSASLGLLARNGASFQSVALNQSIGLILGIAAFYIMSIINFKFLKKHAFYILIGSLLMNLLLFIPSLAMNHGGASRWIDLGFVTFQPSEFLKIAFIIYFSAWLAGVKDKVTNIKFSVVPYMVIMGVIGALLLAQPDTDTLVVIGTTGLVMLFVAGARIKHIALLCLIALMLLAPIVAMRPYAFTRIVTFFNGQADVQGAGYQIQQSLIAVGSGEMFGRGFGQSVQKFNYLPEPIGDSIFAVGAEEFGFFGSVILVGLYLLFFIRSIKISTNVDDIFGRLTVVGIAILILIESFMNISSMLGIIPLSGMPLLFVSHGGTALITALAATGIIANISRYQKNN